MTSLRQQCSGWSPSTPSLTSSVGPQRGGAAHLRSSAVRPHHRCSTDTALVEGFRAYPVQAGCADPSGSARHCSELPLSPAPDSGLTWAARSPIGVYLAAVCSASSPVNCWSPCVFGRRPTNLEQSVGGYHHDRQSSRVSASLENIFVSNFVPGCFILNFLLLPWPSNFVLLFWPTLNKQDIIIFIL
jgi:hypothetical protein